MSHSRYVLALMVSIVLVSWYTWNRDLYSKYANYQSGRTSVDELLSYNRSLTEQRDQLHAQVEGLSHDPVEIEAAIRRTRNLVREGEQIYRIELPEDAMTPPRGEGTFSPGPWTPPTVREPLRRRIAGWYEEAQAYLQERLQSWRDGVYHDSDTRNSAS